MFLAGKVEETPRPLKDVILVSYEIIHKKDPAAVQRIKQKEVYEQQKELILLGERVVLATLGFDLNVHHPYKPLVEAIKKFKVAQNALAQVAWNFVNDGLRTSLCLQFKPHHIAAGAIFLAAKFLKVKLPSDGEKVWWQEFDVTPRQLEEVSNQMLELYEQNRVPPSQGSEAEGSTAGGPSHRIPSKAPLANEENVTNSNYRVGSTTTTGKSGNLKSLSSNPLHDQLYADNHGGAPRAIQSQNNDASDHNTDGESKDNQHPDPEALLDQENMGGAKMMLIDAEALDEGQESIVERSETREVGELKDKYNCRNLEHRESAHGQSPKDAIKMIDKDRVKAALKQRKLRGDIARKTEFMDEDDLIEKELEDGIELAVESEKVKRERKQSWSKPSSRTEHENLLHRKHQEDNGDGHHQGQKRQSSRGPELENVEEGEVPAFNDAGWGSASPKTSRKRKPGSPADKSMEGRQRHDYSTTSHHHNHHDFMDDRNRLGRLGYSDRDHKRHIHENHI
ncbi:cyclin-T1-5-like isoform X2 [Malania oleifera]|nr:cyclin-T1-5-like isoform X2 [Malania oleifera]XP_057949388.1 cyclin-T1-5-like isoform X2 [Malania oleifera]